MKRHSKFLSYLLRHRPDELDLDLDAGGWIDVQVLLDALEARDPDWSHELLHEVVRTNDKQRFEFSSDGSRIRARQGHSVEVDLGLVPEEPPDLLFHGTVAKHLESIRRDGLLPMSRHDVHLSPDRETANVVGSRRGKPLILEIAARAMAEEGHEFRRTANGVWLVAAVPAEFITFPE